MLGTLKYLHLDSDTKSVQNIGSLPLILVGFGSKFTSEQDKEPQFKTAALFLLTALSSCIAEQVVLKQYSTLY